MHEGKGKSLRISTKHSVDNWDSLKPLDSEEKWKTAVEIFHDRIHGRYLTILDRVQTMNNGGFVLVAMDCALVETLQQFRDGVLDSTGKSTEIFKKAMKRPPFNLDETTATVFHKAVRCGLLHKTQTDRGSRISRAGPLTQFEDGQLVVNRDIFHLLVKEAYADYESSILSPRNTRLRRRFEEKMNDIAEKRGGGATT
jgi:hypothetical protein